MGGHPGELHHVEIWVADLTSAAESWEWLLTQLGYSPYQEWSTGQSWRFGATYIVVEQSPALTAREHDRCRPGLNHLAFHAGTSDEVDRLVADAEPNGWTLMFADRHPFAGGDDHYAAYLENSDGFEVELCATTEDT